MALTAATKAIRDAIRREVRRLRNAITEEAQQQFAQQATQQLLPLLKQLNCKRIALYLTNDGELATQPLITALWQLGIEVYLPRLHPFSRGNLIFLAYQPDTALVTNHLGIKEPKLDIQQMRLPHELDMVITPLVAFDSAGNRMGMGGGYYDRTLANWQTQQKPIPIGFAHDCQQIEKLPIEQWDVPLPIIVTPTQLIKC